MLLATAQAGHSVPEHKHDKIWNHSSCDEIQTVTVRLHPFLFLLFVLKLLISLKFPQLENRLVSLSQDIFRLGLRSAVSASENLGLSDLTLTHPSFYYGFATHDHVSGRLAI